MPGECALDLAGAVEVLDGFAGGVARRKVHLLASFTAVCNPDVLEEVLHHVRCFNDLFVPEQLGKWIRAKLGDWRRTATALRSRTDGSWT